MNDRFDLRCRHSQKCGFLQKSIRRIFQPTAALLGGKYVPSRADKKSPARTGFEEASLNKLLVGFGHSVRVDPKLLRQRPHARHFFPHRHLPAMRHPGNLPDDLPKNRLARVGGYRETHALASVLTRIVQYGKRDFDLAAEIFAKFSAFRSNWKCDRLDVCHRT